MATDLETIKCQNRMVRKPAELTLFFRFAGIKQAAAVFLRKGVIAGYPLSVAQNV
jgi:hypothetical protein